MVSRSRGRQTATGKDSKDQEKAEDVESDTQIPVFVCKVTLVGDCITITPDLEKFENGFHNLLTRLNESVESVPVLFDDNVFNPYSQPILYGKMENYKVSLVWFDFFYLMLFLINLVRFLHQSKSFLFLLCIQILLLKTILRNLRTNYFPDLCTLQPFWAFLQN